MMNGFRTSFPANENTIFIWKYHIDHRETSSFWSFLSQQEKARSLAFAFDKDRIRYIFCRGVLRLAISRFLDIEPQLVLFKYTQAGKPYLCCDENCLPTVKFNLSHTDDSMAMALSLNTEIGIDLELIRPIKEKTAIIQNYFTNSEQQYVQRYSGEEATQAFFYCWTRKEALFKGVGSGIASEKIDAVSCLEPHLILSNGIFKEEFWTINSLPFCSTHAAAIAYCGKDHQLLLMEDEWLN